MNEHISSAYDRDLEGITTLIMRMGGLVEEAILKSVKSLSDRDIELAEEPERDTTDHNAITFTRLMLKTNA